MKFVNQTAQLYFPSGSENTAITTDLCIGAHQDDLEIMAYGPISACYGNKERHFTGVVVTDGAGSPRSGVYADCTDETMKMIRVQEQKNAATIGMYNAQFLLAYPSGKVKDPTNRELINEIKEIILACSPDTLYTHNLADKHDTHVAVAMHVIRALREIPAEKRPKQVLGMEVWRGLDWLCDEDKILHDTSKFSNIASSLVGVYDSQVSGGKRYDLATLGRRLANATFFASHAVDDFESASYAVDLTPLIDSDIEPADYINSFIAKFADEVTKRIKMFS